MLLGHLDFDGEGEGVCDWRRGCLEEDGSRVTEPNMECGREERASGGSRERRREVETERPMRGSCSTAGGENDCLGRELVLSWEDSGVELTVDCLRARLRR